MKKKWYCFKLKCYAGIANVSYYELSFVYFTVKTYITVMVKCLTLRQCSKMSVKKLGIWWIIAL